MELVKLWWKAGFKIIEAEEPHKMVCVVSDHVEKERNAFLLAGAPDLLNAAMMESEAERLNSECWCYERPDDCQECVKRIAEARALRKIAIRKAKGVPINA